MQPLADTTVMVPNSAFIAVTVGIVVAFALQLWVLIDAGRRGRWGWLAAILFTFPLGAIAWLAYGRRATPVAE